jgi:hypothetical protein
MRRRGFTGGLLGAVAGFCGSLRARTGCCFGFAGDGLRGFFMDAGTLPLPRGAVKTLSRKMPWTKPLRGSRMPLTSCIRLAERTASC